jgi:hypothetical protein
LFRKDFIYDSGTSTFYILLEQLFCGDILFSLLRGWFIRCHGMRWSGQASLLLTPFDSLDRRGAVRLWDDLFVPWQNAGTNWEEDGKHIGAERQIHNTNTTLHTPP